MAKICFLSGLEIPKGKMSIEHYAPKSRIPKHLAQQSYNLFPAIKVINFAKGNLMPCEWHEQREYRLEYAYHNWKLKSEDRKIIRKALDKGLPNINPCDYCICAKHTQYCVKSR
jgi:hypothetical protein